MYELIQVSPRDYYVDCPTKVGLIRVSDTDVIAVDGGSDKDAGRKVLRAIQANGWRLTAIYNTHAHADHIGGNAYLQAQTGCKIYAAGMECDNVNHPLWEPSLLYGGFPPTGLRHKFLMAQPSSAEPLTAEALPEDVQTLPLPGHSWEMVGFLTSDGTAYLADCVSSEETLRKYGVGYLWDVEAHLNTLEAVKGMKAATFVPAHAPVTDDIAPLAQFNIDAVRSTGDTILELCGNGRTFEEILGGLFEKSGAQMNLQQYALTGSTLRSYLAWLEKQGRVRFEFADNRMLWLKN